MNYKIILASNSPRRKELLAGLDIPFEVKVISGIDESYPVASFKVVNTSLFVPCIWSLFTSTRQFNSCAADRKGRRRSKKYKTFLFISSLLSKTLKWRSFYRLRFNDPPTHNGR